MPDPHLSAHSADPIYSKLLEVDVELAAQEAELMAQLEAVQEKRKGLKTVMELFSPAPPATEPASKPELTAEAITAPIPELSSPISTTEPPAAPPSLQVPNQTSRSARRRRTTQSVKTKPAKQTPSWQPYIQTKYAQTSLAEVVVQMLQDHPEDVFGIPTMVHAIFIDEMPKSVWNQARNRISNILAEGARKNKWYRDQTGQYSLSPAAVGVSLK